MPVKIGNADVRTPQFGLVQLLWQGVGAGAAPFSAQTPVGACGFVVTRNGVGNFTLTFNEKWDGGCLMVKGMLFNATTAKGGTVEMNTKYAPATRTVIIEFVDDAGAPADIASGDELWLEVLMSNRTVAPPLAPV